MISRTKVAVAAYWRCRRRRYAFLCFRLSASVLVVSIKPRRDRVGERAVTPVEIVRRRLAGALVRDNIIGDLLALR
jgi:hypothetical protein